MHFQKTLDGSWKTENTIYQQSAQNHSHMYVLQNARQDCINIIFV